MTMTTPTDGEATFITIGYLDEENVWHAVWVGDDDRFFGDFDGDRDKVIRWSRDRASEIVIWSPADDDFVPLGEESEPRNLQRFETPTKFIKDDPSAT